MSSSIEPSPDTSNAPGARTVPIVHLDDLEIAYSRILASSAPISSQDTFTLLAYDNALRGKSSADRTAALRPCHSLNQAIPSVHPFDVVHVAASFPTTTATPLTATTETIAAGAFRPHVPFVPTSRTGRAIVCTALGLPPSSLSPPPPPHSGARSDSGGLDGTDGTGGTIGDDVATAAAASTFNSRVDTWLRAWYPFLGVLELSEQVQLAGGSVARAVQHVMGRVEPHARPIVDLDIFFAGMTAADAQTALAARLSALHAWTSDNGGTTTIIADTFVTQVTLRFNHEAVVRARTTTIEESQAAILRRPNDGMAACCRGTSKAYNALSPVPPTCEDDRGPRSSHPIIKRRSFVEYKVQFIHRLFAHPSDVLYGFDHGACEVSFNGRVAVTTPLGAFAHARGYIIMDTAHASASYMSRIAKYQLRGFGVLLPFAKDVDAADQGPRARIVADTPCNPRLCLHSVTSQFVHNKDVARHITNCDYALAITNETMLQLPSCISTNNADVRINMREVLLLDGPAAFSNNQYMVQKHLRSFYGCFILDHRANPCPSNELDVLLGRLHIIETLSLPGTVPCRTAETRTAMGRALLDSAAMPSDAAVLHLREVQLTLARAALARLMSPSHYNTLNAAELVRDVVWRVEDPGTQITATFHPLTVSPSDWYGPNFSAERFEQYNRFTTFNTPVSRCASTGYSAVVSA